MMLSTEQHRPEHSRLLATVSKIAKLVTRLASRGVDANPLLPNRVIDVKNETTELHLHVSNSERAPYLALS
jgi:hypothetical protein